MYQDHCCPDTSRSQLVVGFAFIFVATTLMVACGAANSAAAAVGVDEAVPSRLARFAFTGSFRFRLPPGADSAPARIGHHLPAPPVNRRPINPNSAGSSSIASVPVISIAVASVPAARTKAFSNRATGAISAAPHPARTTAEPAPLCPPNSKTAAPVRAPRIIATVVPPDRTVHVTPPVAPFTLQGRSALGAATRLEADPVTRVARPVPLSANRAAALPLTAARHAREPVTAATQPAHTSQLPSASTAPLAARTTTVPVIIARAPPASADERGPITAPEIAGAPPLPALYQRPAAERSQDLKIEQDRLEARRTPLTPAARAGRTARSTGIRRATARSQQVTQKAPATSSFFGGPAWAKKVFATSD